MRLLAALLLIFPLSSAVHLTGYSTSSHFPCSSLSCPTHTSPTKLSSLISSISSSSSHPLLTSNEEPSFTLVVHSSFHVVPSTLLESLATAAPAHNPTSFTSVLEPESSVTTRTVDQVEQDISLGEKFTHVDVKKNEMPKLLQVVKAYAAKHHPLVVLWTTREDAADAADDADAAPGEDPEKPAADDAEDAEKPEEKSTEENVMQPPEIDASQLVGLLTAAVFLLIFVPGFVCLSRIQPPQTFEAFDGTDAKKKMQ